MCPHRCTFLDNGRALSPGSLSCEVYKKARMNSTLEAFQINAFIDPLFSPVIIWEVCSFEYF